MTNRKNADQPTARRRKADELKADAVARALEARFAHAGAHSGARELCRILIRYRLQQLEGDRT
jgi:hypothetical protein